ncbi:GH3 auxin-responsive promoter family protein [Membranihabitans marinus]|uniref:GH3 auxin-responsive promoter family protein n=1 Tax=Membranihabitans marinus TaxID=1227546 RepID=UPI001F411B2A|nr:GH3 auxin-responsive promoter family protein [Membranihabitans marinus]
MRWKSLFIKPFAKLVSKSIDKMAENALADQEKIRKEIVETARQTAFGQDHNFDSIHNYDDFKKNIPVRDYEGLKNYFDRVKDGEGNVLWPEKPIYLAKTSGTTSGAKYIPITRDSLPNHFNTARNALFHYLIKTKQSSFLDGKMIFLSGSPLLEESNGILHGRLSGIVNHEVPNWLKKDQVPTWETNCIEDWETKVDAIVEETKDLDLRLISGIPPWVQMYYERLLKATGKKSVMEVFPNYSVFVYGGVNFEPYRHKLESLVGKTLPSVETYPASEGFIAFQDRFPHEGLLLNTHSGIFFEFIPASEFFDENPSRLSLADVVMNVNYVIILNSNAGLWGYNIGDTVMFTSLNPYRVVVSGRIKHFISAFGEHVIGKEVEEAMRLTCEVHPAQIVEFTVAPQVNPASGLPYHEWFIEFGEMPDDLQGFVSKLDEEMVEQNVYYRDLIEGQILRHLVVTVLQPNAFRNYMKSQGRLGGQNKVPRLANDRKIADALAAFSSSSTL